jgi:hypothetical protein
MGKTTWLLLKTVPEWRWGLEGENTFWYPSMRLFRQKHIGAWAAVLDEVGTALRTLPTPTSSAIRKKPTWRV